MGASISIAILANGAKARREFESTGSAADGLGSKVASAGKKIAAGLAVGALVAGAAVAKLGADSVKSASDAQQSLGATQTVFGKYADGVIKNSNRAATAIGLSANEYRELSNVTGALLAGAGTPLKKVAGITDDLNKRAADMAATFGGTTKEAVESISSLLKGEADPIEKYGVSIKQSDVSARLAAQGLDKLTGSALKQAEQQARLELLMSKTSKTQGAFQRESGTLANQQQVLAAQFENVKAKIGAALLPVLTSAATFLNTTVLPAFENMLPGIKAFASEMGDKLAPVVSKVAGFLIGTLVPALVSIAGFITGTVVPTVVGFATKIGNNLRPVLDALVQVVQKVAAKFKEWQPEIQKTTEVIVKIIGKVLEFSSKILGEVLPVVIKFAGVLLTTLIPVAVTVVSTVAKVIAKVIEFGGSVIDGAKKVGEFAAKVDQKIQDVIVFFLNLPGKIKGALTGAGTMLTGIGTSIVQGLVNGLETARQWVIDKIQQIADTIPEWIRKRLGIASPSKVTTRLGEFVGQGLANGIANTRATVAKEADKAGQKIIERIKNQIDNAKGIRDSIVSMRDSVRDALTGDLFSGAGDEESTALDKFRAQLDSAKAKAAEVAAAVRKLIDAKVGNGFLKNLIASGNTELIVQLAGAPDLASLTSTYQAVIAENEETGRVVAEQVIGTRLDTINATILSLNERLDRREAADREEKRKPVEVRFTAEQVDQLTRGRAIRADLDAYKRAGGRESA